MLKQKLVDEVSAKLKEVIGQSPAADIEKNMRAMLQSIFSKLDLVTREDGDFFNRLSRVGKTMYDPSLMVYHGARRAHKIGWIRLWSSWLSNWLVVALFDRPQAKDWTPVR